MLSHSDRLFGTDDWVEIYSTEDEWEVRLIQATLGNQQIRCRPNYDRKSRQTTLFVNPEHQVEALELVSRIGLAITDNQDAVRQFEKCEMVSPQTTHHNELGVSQIPKATRATPAESTIAEREGIGRIIHYAERGYELQVGPEPYTIVEAAQWEEFSNFSAQRHEFSSLLRHEYPELFQWLKNKKLMGEFIRLVESTYREVPSARVRGNRQSTQNSFSQVEPEIKASGAKICRVSTLSLWFSILSAFTLILQLPWYTSIVSSILAIGTGTVGKYRIGNSRGSLKGRSIALVSIIVACVVVVVVVVRAQNESSATKSPTTMIKRSAKRDPNLQS